MSRIGALISAVGVGTTDSTRHEMIRFLIVDYECTKGHVHSAEEGEQYRLCSYRPYSVLPGQLDWQLMNDHCNTQIGSKNQFE